MKISKAAVLFVLLLLPLGASAEADFTISWDVSGLAKSKIALLEFDLTLGTDFYALHGAFTSTNDLSLPSRGTCYLTEAGGATCHATMGSQSMLLDIEPDLKGAITIFGPSGDLVERGSLKLSSLKG